MFNIRVIFACDQKLQNFVNDFGCFFLEAAARCLMSLKRGQGAHYDFVDKGIVSGLSVIWAGV
jgi:hypothetical protein